MRSSEFGLVVHRICFFGFPCHPPIHKFLVLFLELLRLLRRQRTGPVVVGQHVVLDQEARAVGDEAVECL